MGPFQRPDLPQETTHDAVQELKDRFMGIDEENVQASATLKILISSPRLRYFHRGHTLSWEIWQLESLVHHLFIKKGIKQQQFTFFI